VNIISHVLIILITIPIVTTALAVSIWIICDKNPNVYEEQGKNTVILKCLILVSLMTIVGVITNNDFILTLITTIIGYVLIMGLFGISFIKALLVNLSVYAILRICIELPLRLFF
jgi:hypothetical protein